MITIDGSHGDTLPGLKPWASAFRALGEKPCVTSAQSKGFGFAPLGLKTKASANPGSVKVVVVTFGHCPPSIPKVFI